MNENKKYGIIREQGEYMEPVPLTPEENATINKENAKNESSKDKNN